MFAIKWEDKYFCNAKNNHWITDITKAQKFKTVENAIAFAAHACIGKEVKCVDENTKEEADITTLMTNDIKLTEEEVKKAYADLLIAVEQFGAIAEKIPAIISYYKNIQSDEDKRQEDILHKLEFSPAGNITFVKLGRMLKESRMRRREAKDIISYLLAISTAIPSNLLAIHNKTFENFTNREYTPRIATELFNKGE